MSVATRQRPGAFPIRPTLRSPAKELGPRANRTIARILEATRSIFLTRGYAGTTVDEIARVAGVSRASFYTYFPTKRDVLLALGGDSASAASALIAGLDGLGATWAVADVERFVDDYFTLLDEHGSFALAWTQAAHEDDEIRRAGMKRHLQTCRQLGVALGRLRGEPFDDPAARGLAVLGMFERTWSYARLYAPTVDAADLRRELAAIVASTLREPSRPTSTITTGPATGP
jgi:TetR/AcrR family transcriptional regulator